MKKFKNIIIVLILPIVFFLSCDNEKFTDSIFKDVPVLDTAAFTYRFDKWLYDNYLVPYNLDFRYKMQDVGSDQGYNLVPADLIKSEQLAHLIRYLWFDVYGTIVDEDFLKFYGPRMIQLIGSSAINASLGTEILGTAEGGIKVTLYVVNRLNLADLEHMNRYYFHVMHHEFMHILHQTKAYPREYAAISAGKYDPMGWQLSSDAEANELGFVTNYSMSESQEDFVEVISTYITKSDAGWKQILNNAAKGGIEKDKDGKIIKTGKDVIEQKFEICRAWLEEKWDIDLHALHNEVQYRQANMDMEKIMNDDY